MLIAPTLLALLDGQAAPGATLDGLDSRPRAAAVRVVTSDPAATRRALDDLIARVDASVHSDRQHPGQRKVEYDHAALALGGRVGSIFAAATGDRTYARRFAARQQRLSGTTLLNQRRYRDALVPLTAARREAQALGDTWLELITRINIAHGQLDLGRGAQALSECEHAAELAKGSTSGPRAASNSGRCTAPGPRDQSIEYSRQAAAASHQAGIALGGNSC